ncbi:hypothetical protein V7087_18070 [Neobacillus niacini]|uniref:hypothetical protein n=1 Tax=Neobacillus niacini TaxID=86668 RepID=UPI003000F306
MSRSWLLKGWKVLYNERTSVVRCNLRMKTYLTAAAIHVWFGREEFHQYLNEIVMLSFTTGNGSSSSKYAS